MPLNVRYVPEAAVYASRGGAQGFDEPIPYVPILKEWSPVAGGWQISPKSRNVEGAEGTMPGVAHSRREILIASAAFTTAALFMVPVTAADADTDTKPAVTEVNLLYDTGAKLIGVMFKFNVKDLEEVQKNKFLAEKLLPDAIAYAEARGIPMIAIQANQTTSRFFGLLKTGSAYGYVWEQDSAGAWIEYIKKAP